MVFWKNWLIDLFIYLFIIIIIIIIIYFLNKWAWPGPVRLGWVDWRPNNLFSFFNIGLDLAQPSRLGWNRSNLAYNCWRKPTGCELINVLHSKKKGRLQGITWCGGGRLVVMLAAHGGAVGEEVGGEVIRVEDTMEEEKDRDGRWRKRLG